MQFPRILNFLVARQSPLTAHAHTHIIRRLCATRPRSDRKQISVHAGTLSAARHTHNKQNPHPRPSAECANMSHKNLAGAFVYTNTMLSVVTCVHARTVQVVGLWPRSAHAQHISRIPCGATKKPIIQSQSTYLWHFARARRTHPMHTSTHHQLRLRAQNA